MHMDELASLVDNIEAKALANDHVPWAAKLFIHVDFDQRGRRLCCVLFRVSHPPCGRRVLRDRLTSYSWAERYLSRAMTMTSLDSVSISSTMSQDLIWGVCLNLDQPSILYTGLSMTAPGAGVAILVCVLLVLALASRGLRGRLCA